MGLKGIVGGYYEGMSFIDKMKSSRSLVGILVLLCGAVSVLLVGMTLGRHAQAIKTIDGIDFQFTNVSIASEEPPILVTVEMGHRHNMPYRVLSIFAELRAEDTVVGIATREHIDRVIEPDETVTLLVPMELSWAVSDVEELHRRFSDQEEWTLIVRITSQIPHKRELHNAEFHLEESVGLDDE